jgi:FKBP-type peptidyl-prolyl cis-trans isomerase
VEGKSFMGKVKDNAQRIVILMAVVGFVFSSVAVTALYFLQNKDQKNPQSQQAEAIKKLKEQQEAQMPKEPLTGFQAAAFDPATITELKVETLTPGEGKEATKDSTVSANYFGWTSDGKIFDSTQKGATAAPIDFPLNGVIPGWTEGLTGVKAGSTVKLSIPAEKAYGSTDDGSGRPFGPLVFIIELKDVK